VEYLPLFQIVGVLGLAGVLVWLSFLDLKRKVRHLEAENMTLRQRFNDYVQAMDAVTYDKVQHHLNRSRPLAQPPTGFLPTLHRCRQRALDEGGDPYMVAVGWDELQGNPDVVAVSFDNRREFFAGHMAITGETGSGKSTLAFLILAQLAHNLTTGQGQLFCIDPKRDSALWRGKAHNWREPVLGRDPEQISAAMQLLRDERERRELLLERHRVLEFDDLPLALRPPLLVVYVAELDVLKLGCGGKLDDWLTTELGTSRAAGIRYILDFQNASGRETSWRSHIGCYLAGVQYAQDAVKPNIGMSVNEIRELGAIPMHELGGVDSFTVRLGRAVLSVRTPHLTLAHRIDVLNALPDAPRPGVLDRAAAATVPATSTATIAVAPAERQRIIEAARRSTSRSEVCRLVYNSKPSGEAYQKVKQVLDEEGLLLPRKPGQVVEAA
jgi:hypothetical protein